MALEGVGFSRRKGARFDVCDGSVVAQRLKGSENGERKEDSENGRFHSQRKNSECGRSQGEEGGQGNELTHGPHERENSEHTATLLRFRIQSHSAAVSPSGARKSCRSSPHGLGQSGRPETCTKIRSFSVSSAWILFIFYSVRGFVMLLWIKMMCNVNF